jgi:hypothetical protein
MADDTKYSAEKGPVYDRNGNPDVMGSKPLGAKQISVVNDLKLEFNALHQKLCGTYMSANPEAARLLNIAKTHLELGCMAAVKAVSRMTKFQP